jgi:hypothetical protein
MTVPAPAPIAANSVIADKALVTRADRVRSSCRSSTVKPSPTYPV